MMSIADTIPRLNFVVIDGSEMRFYVGDTGTAFDGDMVMKLYHTIELLFIDSYMIIIHL